MSTKAGTIGVAGRPTGFVVWTGIVSALAAAALIMSAIALTEARDDGSVAGAVGSEPLGVASAQAPLWDAGKLEAMEGRVLAESVDDQGYVLWDDGKLAAMAGRVLAAGTANDDYVLWDEAKLEAMAGRTQAGN
jgi:hypothetical protein